MRTKIFIAAVLSVFLLSFSACKLDSESNYTPKLSLYQWAKVNSDSLLMKHTTDGNIGIDSLYVNDTVTIFLFANAYTNFLTKFEYAVNIDSVLDVLVVDSIKKEFDESSDFVNGKIVMKENVFGMRYPFQFVTKKPTDKVKIKFEVESTAEKVPNRAGLILEFPIKP